MVSFNSYAKLQEGKYKVSIPQLIWTPHHTAMGEKKTQSCLLSIPGWSPCRNARLFFAIFMFRIQGISGICHTNPEQTRWQSHPFQAFVEQKNKTQALNTGFGRTKSKTLSIEDSMANSPVPGSGWIQNRNSSFEDSMAGHTLQALVEAITES